MSVDIPGSTGWRDDMRKHLIEKRQALPVATRKEADALLAHRLEELLTEVSGRTISIYWPFRGEPDLRAFARGCRDRGATIALPLVVRKAAPLEFREWREEDQLERGVWNIPVPPQSAPLSQPDIVIAPVVGVDAQSFRLGYGGGFFDRSLAALRDAKTAIAIGVGYEMQRMETIHPHHFDIPMDHVLLAKA